MLTKTTYKKIKSICNEKISAVSEIFIDFFISNCLVQNT